MIARDLIDALPSMRCSFRRRGRDIDSASSTSATESYPQLRTVYVTIFIAGVTGIPVWHPVAAQRAMKREAAQRTRGSSPPARARAPTATSPPA